MNIKNFIPEKGKKNKEIPKENRDQVDISLISSLVIPILAFIIQNLTVYLIFFLVDFFFGVRIFGIWYLIYSSLSSFLLILFPLAYKKVSTNNRCIQNTWNELGLTIKSSDKKTQIKGVSLGIAYAIIGLLLINVVFIISNFIITLFIDPAIFTSQGVLIQIDIPYINKVKLIQFFIISVIMSLIVAPCEEIIYRGFMQRGLMRNIGKKRGLILTAILFSFFHVVPLFVTVPLFSLEFLIRYILSFFPYLSVSLLLGLLFLKRKQNLVPTIVMHGMFNFLNLFFSFIIIYYPELFMVSSGIMIGGLIGSLLSILLIEEFTSPLDSEK